MSEFPTADMELSTILVVRDVTAAVAWYRDVLGARLHREYGGTTAVFEFQGTWLVLTTAGEPTKDKPDVTFAPPPDPNNVSHSFTIRVPDCQAAYKTLRDRGAIFLTEPVTWDGEVRAFFRDVDGHLFEISEAR